MPFGKYSGQPMSRLPLDYVIWLRDNVDLREPLKTTIEAHYYRLTWPHVAPPWPQDWDVEASPQNLAQHDRASNPEPSAAHDSLYRSWE